ncbi:hypothetical protein [Luteimonas terrae]|nr:hypothetical protein [Luteimonas terrae]
MYRLDSPPPGTSSRYFELINVSHDAVVSVTEARPGGAQGSIALSPLRGGHHTAMLELASAPCIRDFRIGLRDGRTLIYRDINVCRSRGLYVRTADMQSESRDLADAAAEGGE